jgi:hypothetical protein
MVMHNALCSKEVPELLDLSPKVVLSISFEQLECRECVTPACHVVTHFEASVIVNEGNTMLPPHMGMHLVFLQIRMNEIKRMFRTMTSRWKRTCIQLSCKAGFTDGIWVEVNFAPVTRFLLRMLLVST